MTTPGEQGIRAAKWDAVAFNQRWPEALAMPDGKNASGTSIDLVYAPEVNNFNGRGTMQLRVLDFRQS